MSQRKVKITDVAEYAGVSVSTVSLVLGNKGRISEATINKVNEAIKALGYVRNKAAANLRSNQSNLVGLVLKDITDPFYTEITAGFSQILEKHGFMLFLAQCGDSPERLEKCVQSMIQQGVAGVAFSPLRGASQRVIDMLAQAEVPAVCVARATVNDDIDYVVPDNTLAAKRATQHLVEQGHRHIAYVGGQGDSLTRAERIGGYCTTLIQYGLPFKSEWIVECEGSQKAAASTVQELLTQHPKITAILCHRPATALGAVYGVERANRTVGRDNYIGQQVALIGFDDVAEAELTHPPLTFMSSTANDIGDQAGKRLVQKMKASELAVEKVVLAPELIIRGSA
ncbi:Mal regulon transcriptional regulator MalI (plasmid) [Photobacterium sp. DA100]|uniref:Mal regulon transcriptional regulator MalI n=1 Tax=Photobacterium sp. DA100 TaxID=3027472 RepID=UPI00247B25BD|nr:Mal regulon transcriptional regulator MalI [Photobacterium sp. DA100]WEM44984.1 Mal regulon transcriptional regulator MalI [Photobacterium sp. DA100]